MLAIVFHTIDDCAYPFTKQARVQRKDGAYHETIEVYDPIFPHIREAPDCPVFVGICVTPVLRTVKAGVCVMFPESMDCLISPRSFPGAKHQLADKGRVENFSLSKCISPKRRVTNIA